MPVVQNLAIGNNTTAIKGLDTRVQVLEGHRGADQPAVSLPPDWTLVPQITALIGSTGCAWVMYAGNVELIIDGSVTAYGTLAGVTGLTPGWHNFQLQAFGHSNFAGAFLTVWPL